MVLFFSDMHFGRDDRPKERAIEAELIRCLRHLEAEATELVLVGDVFDQFIEYRHLVPKGCVRLLGLLAEWVDAGRRVSYLVGNHDPWHLDYLTQEIGVDVYLAGRLFAFDGVPVWVAHGDQYGSRVPLYAPLKALLRHPVPVWFYRNLLPADLGVRLARAVLRRTHTDVINPDVTRALREKARTILAEHSARIVVMGHSHAPERFAWPEGVYVNTGCWRTTQTFAILDNTGVRLQQWNGSCILDVESFSELP